MNSRPELKLDWCGHAAAKYAVEHWHYSRSMPCPPVVKIGVWESSRFIGCVLFSRGANKNLGKPYGLKDIETCELTRVALDQHVTPASRIVAIAVSLLRKKEIGLRLCVSFADENQGHIGTLYQAGGWVFSGKSKSTPKYITKDGEELHQRQVSVSGFKPQFGTVRKVPTPSDCIVVPQLDKWRYLMPLDAEMRKRIMPLAKPYPKRAGSDTQDTPSDQDGKGGATPTPALHPHGGQPCQP
ncbi:MAG: Microbacterium phage Appa [Verrucomicrobiota bacterium]|jgi:hypothetical protein